jgi:hypothetical protein
MEAIRHRLGIEAPRAQAAEKLTTIEGLATWWTHDVTGDPGVGGTLEFSFGGPDRSLSMHVVEASEERVVWECTEGPDEWVGNPFTFELEQTDHETVVMFTQVWREPGDFMAHCSTKWAYFLLGLKAGLEGGKATPYPGELQISSWG